MSTSLFYPLELPNPVVWFYGTFALALAIYFQFQRLFAWRNFDIVALFLFAPGFLIIEGAGRDPSIVFLGYVWLLVACLFWFVRCLIDVMATKRPRVAVNLSTIGLYWLGGALLLALCVNAATKSVDSEPVGKRTGQLNGVEESVTEVVQLAQPAETKILVSRGIAIGCQIAVVTLLILIGTLVYRETAIGASAAGLYLLLPSTSYRFDQSHHVWPTALLLGAFLGYRRPVAAGILFGIAVGTSFFPVLLLPVWMQFYRGRGLGTFLAWYTGFLVISLACTVPALVFGGEFTSGIWQTLNLADWLPWRVAKLESIWTGVYWAYRLPVFIIYIVMVVGSLFWPTVRDFGQLLAANAALLIGIQFWFGDRGGAYMLWFAPLVILMILRPTTTELQPPIQNRRVLFGWLRRRRTSNLGTAPSLAV